MASSSPCDIGIIVMKSQDGYTTGADGYTVGKLKSRTAELPRGEFVAVWMLLMTLHALCAAYLLATARLYFFMEQPLMAYFSDLLARPEQRRFRSFGVVVGLLGAFHALHLVLHIGSSIQARALVVWPRTAIVKRCLRFARISKRKVTTPTHQAAAGRTATRTFIGLKSQVDIEGRHFELAFVLQKVVEVVAQINQCRHYSVLISRVWISQAFVGLVAANCLLTALLNHLMLAAASHIRERTLCVAVDALLSTISCLVLPLAIFMHWALQFDSELWTFPMEVLYGDTAFTRLVYENQAIFALSVTDSIAKLVPHLSILLSLSSISFILERFAPDAVRSMRRIAVVPTVLAAKQRVSLSQASPKSHPVKLSTFLQHVVPSVGFFTTAAVVLALHFEAANLVSNADPSITQMCLESVRPWLARNLSCSVVKFNCYRHGVASPAPNVLENLQREALTSIIFEHCPAFIMPTSIRDFPNLLGIEIWNVTLERWGTEAALNAALHPKMVFLIMAHVDMATLPQGVLSPPFPDLLSDIEIVCTNLTKIPEEVAGVWNTLQVIYVETSPLQEFPTALFRLPVSDVSLVNTGLEELPDDLFTSDIYPSSYEQLALSYNPLKALPESARNELTVDELWLSYTSLSTLSSWIEAAVSEVITLGGSPVCEDIPAQLLEVVDCTKREWDPLNSGSYPLAYVASSRQL